MKEVKKLKDIIAGRGTIKAQILKDATGYIDIEDEQVSYIRDAAEHGCNGGNCRNLIYYAETHAFYELHAEEIDEILAEIEEETGEPYNIRENMKRLNEYDLRNFLAWFSYEVEARKIINEIEAE